MLGPCSATAFSADSNTHKRPDSPMASIRNCQPCVIIPSQKSPRDMRLRDSIGRAFVSLLRFVVEIPRPVKSPTLPPQEISPVDHAALPFADGGQIAVVRLTQWLDWVTQKNDKVFVALPMIQRGAVWSADKIASLWDSLLRGMPVGSLTVSRFQKNETKMLRIIEAKEKRARPQPIKEGDLSLLDGQQRTLAMCIGWHGGENMDRRVWVDFGQSGVRGQPFRLRVTTIYQPFGFNPYDQSKKLSRHELRTARNLFDEKDVTESWKGAPNYSLPLSKTTPYGAIHALELWDLIREWQGTGQDADAWHTRILTRRPVSEGAPKDEIENRIREFGTALNRLFTMQIALVRVAEELVDDSPADEDNAAEPALVVLFERIANSGSPLSRADYVFSLIKHRFPDAHNFVQDLHGNAHVSSLLSANDLVMTAVRLATNTHSHGGRLFSDIPTPSPKEFGRILRAKVDPNEGDFLETALMPLIREDSPLYLLKTFEHVHRLIAFREGFSPSDPGLPKLAFPLLQRELVQVLVLWVHRRLITGLPEKILMQQVEASRPEILRFVLFWLLCVGDREKDREAAGKRAFERLREGEDERFPGKELSERLCKKGLAVQIQRPDAVESCAISPGTSGVKIRSWGSRFNVNETDTSFIRDSRILYARWFNRKELLLWLQRKTLVLEFKGADPLAGREEETPYDYDHICPHNDWGRPAYRSSRRPLEQFCEDGASWIVGNSIGNYRVWDSSSNREDQDDPAPCKLRLIAWDASETQKILEYSTIAREEAEGLKACSVEKGDQGCWDEDRALAFQDVVEKRAFRLFKQYFDEAGFAEWIPAPTEMAG